MINYVYQLVAPKVFSIKYEDISLDNDVIVKPIYMALCHADQRYYTGNRSKAILSKKLPMALVHECCGRVVFDKSGTYKPGQTVVLIPNIPGEYSDEIYENYGSGAKFMSSGCDGFMREYVNISKDRIVSFENIPLNIAAITEFISVGVHAIERFKKLSHSNKERIGVWGDGSLAFVVSNLLKKEFPESKIIVFGKHRDKLALFSFVDETYLVDEIPKGCLVSHAFECVGGESSTYAIDDIINYITPQGSVVLMGVSENNISINTRDILEKGLLFIGSSRSGYSDFSKAITFLQDISLQKRLQMIIHNHHKVESIEDLHKVFNEDYNTPFKTVFEWGL